MATTRKRTTRRKPRKRAATAPPRPIDPQGQPLHVLDVPFDARSTATANGARWDAARGAHVFVGDDLPSELALFLPDGFSWAARLAEDACGGHHDHPAEGDVVLRTHQADAVQRIVAAHDAGLPGFLLADDVGLGKTYTALAAIQAMPASRRDVLVVCPKSVMPAWRQSIRAMGTGGRRFTVINHDGLKKLLEVPQSAMSAKKATTRNRRIAQQGRSKVDWDVVVHDESHVFRNPTSQRSAASRTVSAGAFTIWASATAGQNPLELTYLASLLGAVTGTPVADLEAFQEWCADIGLSITRGQYGRWDWDRNTGDVELVRRLLFDRWTNDQPPAGIRRVPSDIVGWPTQQHIPHPVQLDADGQRLYDSAWTAFRLEMELARRGNDPTGALAAQTRFRQKASLIRVPAVADHVRTLLESGRQVYVSVTWLETLEALRTELARGRSPVPTTVIHGSLPPAEREANRNAFQTGRATVILSTVAEGINCHASEPGANGVPRATVIADARWSGIATHQVCGRTGRDGDASPAYHVYAERTVEQTIVQRMCQRLGDMAAWQGDDDAFAAELEAALLDGIGAEP